MEIADLLDVNAVLPGLRSTSKKQALQDLSKAAATLTGQDERNIFHVLLDRERLGTTGVGNGIAIPHAKLPELDRLHGLFAMGTQSALMSAQPFTQMGQGDIDAAVVLSRDGRLFREL